MKRVLVLILLLLPFSLLNSAARMQEPLPGLPKASDYPPAGRNCKRKVRLTPWVGMPAVDWPRTFYCVLDIHTCEGVKKYRSGVRRSGANMCADYSRVYYELVNREICCDSKCESPKESFQPGGESDELNPFDCKNLQNLEIALLADQVTASACGRVLLRRPADSREELENTARRWRNRAPVKICCDRLSPDELVGEPGAERPLVGVEGEVLPDAYRDTDFYTFAGGATVDPFPEGMRIPHVLPDTSCEGCKWILMSGKLKCTPQGPNSGLFWYEANWKCPDTAVEVFKASRQRVLPRSCPNPQRPSLN
jgi:hypothetical protein